MLKWMNIAGTTWVVYNMTMTACKYVDTRSEIDLYELHKYLNSKDL